MSPRSLIPNAMVWSAPGTLMRVSSPPERRRKEHARVESLLARFGTHPVLAITTRDAEAMYEDLKRRTVGQGEDKRPVAIATVNR